MPYCDCIQHTLKTSLHQIFSQLSRFETEIYVPAIYVMYAFHNFAKQINLELCESTII